MPALEMAQEAGVLVAWLKHAGDEVAKGEPLMEIETDKVTVEIEAAASGILGGISAHEGDRVPVGQTIAWILAPGEEPPHTSPIPAPAGAERGDGRRPSPQPAASSIADASPVARKMAEEHGLDLSRVKPSGRRIEKADVATYLREHAPMAGLLAAAPVGASAAGAKVRASPKARRLAAESGIDLRALKGSGPDGAVLIVDLPATSAPTVGTAESTELPTVWRLMAERMTASWISAPHFYLTREVDAGSMVAWHGTVAAKMAADTGIKPSYTDLLTKLVATVLPRHPRLNAAWAEGNVRWNQRVNIGLAVAVEDGLVVPVVHDADTASLADIARTRSDLVDRARKRRLRPADIAGGTFTLTNLGMYNVDAFSPIINPPQAAILAAGRIVERVVPQAGQLVIQPRLILTLACDHRVVDGARAAQFLDDLANLIEVPLSVLG